tara:strand:+ start:24751 stop:24900 length:150 start_codon:yes stop_codon:yes gene_type:complete
MQNRCVCQLGQDKEGKIYFKFFGSFYLSPRVIAYLIGVMIGMVGVASMV